MDQAQLDQIVARTANGEAAIDICISMGVDWEAATNWLRVNSSASDRFRTAEKQGIPNATARLTAAFAAMRNGLKKAQVDG